LQFLHGLIRFRNDPYLQEMRELLEQQVGVEVSDSTVWRSLARSGFTMKKVYCIAFVISWAENTLRLLDMLLNVTKVIVAAIDLITDVHVNPNTLCLLMKARLTGALLSGTADGL
jgi:hypothetical protein